MSAELSAHGQRPPAPVPDSFVDAPSPAMGPTVATHCPTTPAVARHSVRLGDHGPMESAVLIVSTGTRTVTDITREVAQFCAGQGDGLLNAFAPHATAGLALMELGSGSEPDLDEALGRLLPRDDRYRHRHGSPGHGADHLLPVLVSPSLTVPVLDGRLQLGTWQSLVVIDGNADNPTREVRLSFVPA
jgi:secondary thiamine-phosphate synthase enzyme